MSAAAVAIIVADRDSRTDCADREFVIVTVTHAGILVTGLVFPGISIVIFGYNTVSAEDSVANRVWPLGPERVASVNSLSSGTDTAALRFEAA